MDHVDFDPSIALNQMSRKDALHLASLLIDDLRRNQFLLASSLASGDQPTGARAGHSLGNITANAGCESVCMLAADLERQIRKGQPHETAGPAERLRSEVATLIGALERWRSDAGAATDTANLNYAGRTNG